MGFDGSVFHWVILTFPHYQYNRLGIFKSEEGSGKLSVIRIMYLEIIHRYLYSELQN